MTRTEKNMSLPGGVVSEIKTPAYVFDIDELTSRMNLIRNKLGRKIRLVFAVKANPFLVRSMIPLVDAFEVCSPGEERICRKAGVPSSMLVLSGVNKEAGNFRELIRLHGSRAVYTVESLGQMEMLSGLAREAGVQIRVLLRLSNGSQFGMDEAVLRDILSRADRYDSLQICGLHYFTGTQKKPKRFEKEMRRLGPLLAQFPGLLRELEYGPGLAVTYFEGDSPEEEITALETLARSLEELPFDGRITVEMGRFIAASCGSYVTSVADVKRNDGTNYCIVDGGIHQVNYYGQNMAMKIPGIDVVRPGEDGRRCAADSETGTETWTVCGSLCTTADVLVRQWAGGDLRPGDRLVFEKTGAYAVTEGVSLFLSRDLPGVYLLKEGDLKKIRENIKTEDLNNGTSD